VNSAALNCLILKSIDVQDVQVCYFVQHLCAATPVACNKLSLRGINLGISKGTGRTERNGLQHCRDKENEAPGTN
jgi:hypothetical protein